MKFLFVSEFVPTYNSGAEGSLLLIGDALKRRGHSVEYLWKDPAPGLVVHPRLYELWQLPARQLARVREALLGKNFDVVIVSQPYAYEIHEKLAGEFPRTLFLNRTHGWEDRLAESWKRLHWRRPSAPRAPLVALATRAMSRACRRTAVASQGTIAGSQLCAKYIQARYGVAGERVAVIANGVEHALFSRRRDRGYRGPVRMLFVGQYLPRKGTQVLEAVLPGLAARFPEARMTFVVPGESSEAVVSAYRPAFGDRMTVKSWMQREELARVYSEHDLLLFPSFFEGFGKVFLEGMAAGLCVAGFAEGGFPDIARHQRDALLCAPGDTAAFQGLVEWALLRPDQARAMGDRAREVALPYTWDRNAQATENFCRRLKFGQAEVAAASSSACA